ncbi:MAG TPA: 50S ribosomal protein L10 [Candidatus Saccharimonadales bacterium]|nr:50S ribosomal protein L10 [Candidatus Saccharimonadales bacterium]
MALTKDKKNEVVEEISQLLADSKLTVISAYKGTPVKAMQALRRQARDNGTKVQVVKNRLVIQALKSNEATKQLDTSALTGMLLYAFNSEDEVAPAQAIAEFAKKQPTLQFVGAITAEGDFMAAEDVKALAALPSKTQLIAGIIGTLNSPVNGVMSGLAGNLHGLLDGLAAKAAVKG